MHSCISYTYILSVHYTLYTVQYRKQHFMHSCISYKYVLRVFSTENNIENVYVPAFIGNSYVNFPKTTKKYITFAFHFLSLSCVFISLFTRLFQPILVRPCNMPMPKCGQIIIFYSILEYQEEYWFPIMSLAGYKWWYCYYSYSRILRGILVPYNVPGWI